MCRIDLKKDKTELRVKVDLSETVKTIPLTAPYDNLPMNQYSNFKMYQIYDNVMKAYILEIVVNGIPLASTVNTAPKAFKDVKVFTNIAGGDLSKVYFKNFYVFNLS